MRINQLRLIHPFLAAALIAVFCLPALAHGAKPPEFPKLEDVTKDYEKITETARNEPGLFTLWVNEKKGSMLATLPRGYESKKFFIALTVAGGERFAGLQAGDMYVYWKRYDKRLALIRPNITIRSEGDQESKASVDRLFTDQVLLDVPIRTMDGGRPVIDLTGLCVGQASRFFGPGMRVTNPSLVTIKKAKTFPQNIEVAFEVPTGGGGGLRGYLTPGSSGSGTLKTLHYSISIIPSNPAYKPRVADERIGYFTTHYFDFGEFKEHDTVKRFVNRWHLEKADPSLELSPPKNPIIFYLEHTTPIRYRRWVREGVLGWNRAFEKIGIADAIEVRYQDARTGAYMDKDPEDVRWNFISWLNNDYGTAIGPSRVNPLTGEILDADIILTDGWIRHFRFQFDKVMPQIAMEGFSPETMDWLAKHPEWDPRVRMAAPAQRRAVQEAIAAQMNSENYHLHPAMNMDPHLIGDDPYDGLYGRTSQVNGMCMAADYMAMDLSLARMTLDMLGTVSGSGCAPVCASDPNCPEAQAKNEEQKKPSKPVSMLDGVPEEVIGPMLAHLVAHEVGHTLGLRHNFKASSIYTLEEINGPDMEDKPYAASVMDYMPINMTQLECKNYDRLSMKGIGPYDMWAIEYGYTLKNDLKPILARVADPLLPYATDEDTWGPDPLARRYDFSKNPLEYAKTQIALADYHREHLLESFVKDGESWAQARRGYELSLGLHMRATSMMANWIGGSFVYRDHKGDKNGRMPVNPVPAQDQRDALQFLVEYMFQDEAYGLSSELLQHMTVAKWWDDSSSIFSDPTWPIHDRIGSMQASVLSSLMNPTVLRYVYDNEFVVDADQDALTLPEMLDTLTDSIWSEYDKPTAKPYTARQPLVSSLRRNLQSEHLSRLISLSVMNRVRTSAYQTIGDLAQMHLIRIKEERIESVLGSHGERLDAYTQAHLKDAAERIGRALDAIYIQQ